MVPEGLSRARVCAVNCKDIARRLPRPGELATETRNEAPRAAACFSSVQCWSVEDQVFQILYIF